MNTTVSRLTILFEAPFWIGLYEREEDGRYAAFKILFGSEPKDYEVYDFLLRSWKQLRFSPCIEAASAVEKRVNPKRMQRLIQRQLTPTGVGTKAQQALRLLQEQGKRERRSLTRAQREAEKDRQWQRQKEKHREKHRGH